jgi:hypothetical protein
MLIINMNDSQAIPEITPERKAINKVIVLCIFIIYF